MWMKSDFDVMSAEACISVDVMLHAMLDLGDYGSQLLSTFHLARQRFWSVADLRLPMEMWQICLPARCELEHSEQLFE